MSVCGGQAVRGPDVTQRWESSDDSHTRRCFPRAQHSAQEADTKEPITLVSWCPEVQARAANREAWGSGFCSEAVGDLTGGLGASGPRQPWVSRLGAVMGLLSNTCSWSIWTPLCMCVTLHNKKDCQKVKMPPACQLSVHTPVPH